MLQILFLRTDREYIFVLLYDESTSYVWMNGWVILVHFYLFIFVTFATVKVILLYFLA